MTEPATYVHRPTRVTAMQFTQARDANRWDLENWLYRELGRGKYELADDHIVIETLEGDRDCPSGYWIVKGIHGEFYPVHPDVFADAYEPAAGVQ